MQKRTNKLLFIGVVLLGHACAEDGYLDPAAVQNAYLVAHGMATSYARRPDADPTVVQRLAVLDDRAAQAMRAQDTVATQSAVAALTRLAARQ